MTVLSALIRKKVLISSTLSQIIFKLILVNQVVVYFETTQFRQTTSAHEITINMHIKNLCFSIINNNKTVKHVFVNVNGFISVYKGLLN